MKFDSVEDAYLQEAENVVSSWLYLKNISFKIESSKFNKQRCITLIYTTKL